MAHPQADFFLAAFIKCHAGQQSRHRCKVCISFAIDVVTWAATTGLFILKWTSNVPLMPLSGSYYRPVHIRVAICIHSPQHNVYQRNNHLTRHAQSTKEQAQQIVFKGQLCIAQASSLCLGLHLCSKEQKLAVDRKPNQLSMMTHTDSTTTQIVTAEC